MKQGSLECGALRFLGAMAAANAHEIKNALAVINENAGLLEDLVRTAQAGRALDLPRLKRMAETIQQQVVRTDRIAKSTHRFCRCAEQSIQEADLDRCLDLVAEMATRFTALREVRVALTFGEGSTIVPVRPLSLLDLLWRCLSGAIRSADGGDVLRVAVARTDSTATVRWIWPGAGHGELAADLRACPETTVLLRACHGGLTVDAGAQALLLTLTLNHPRS